MSEDEDIDRVFKTRGLQPLGRLMEMGPAEDRVRESIDDLVYMQPFKVMPSVVVNERLSPLWKAIVTSEGMVRDLKE